MLVTCPFRPHDMYKLRKLCHHQGRSQKFVSEGDKIGGLGTEVPQRSPGTEPWWVSGGEAPEAARHANNHCNNVRTKNS